MKIQIVKAIYSSQRLKKKQNPAGKVNVKFNKKFNALKHYIKLYESIKLETTI